MLFKIVDTDNLKVICDGLNTYEQAWEALEQIIPNAKLAIEEYKKPVTGLGRDPDLH